jgi:signal transduction histidine kinase/ligand-binding sensor domain-containing protein
MLRTKTRSQEQRRTRFVALQVALLSSILSSVACPQTSQDFHHTAWASESGLGAVFNVQQSADGFLWLTTSRGVLRFDGERFDSVEQVTFGAVKDNDILSAFAASSGSIWLTTRSAGMLRWKNGSLNAFSDRRCTPANLNGGMIDGDGEDTLWFASTSGLAHLNGGTCELIGPARGYPGGFPKALMVDRDRTVWAVTLSDTLLFKPRGQSVFRPFHATIHSSGTAVVLRQDAAGAIWISDDCGIRRLVAEDRPRTESCKKATPSSRDFSFAPDGSLWTVTAEGVSAFSSTSVASAAPYLIATPTESFTTQEGLSSDGVRKIFIDREGTLWVGTNSGLDSLHRSYLHGLSLPHTQENEIGVAPGDAGSIWIGSRSMPLTHVFLDGTLKSFPEITQLTCIRRDREGTLWVGSWNSSAIWRSDGGRLVKIPGPIGDNQPVVALEVDRRNTPWIYTLNGSTYRMLNGSWINVNQVLGKKTAVLGAMTSDETGNIWFAFSDKVVKWNGDSFERFSYPHAMLNISPATMSARNQHVWLAGRGGVDLFSRGRFYQMRWKHGDPVGRVSGIKETASGELWINGFSGVTHISASALAAWLRNPMTEAVTENFDTSDGLPGFSGERHPEPSLVQAPDGKIWFATTKGVAWLDPRTLDTQRNRVQPPVVITSITANGHIFPGWKDIILPPPVRDLEVDYTALSLALPKRVLFRYKLEGYDRDWQTAGTRRQVFYTGLAPGRYRMRVTASNNDGLWSDTGASVTLTLKPAFYQTNWFFILCGMITLASGWKLYRFRVKRLAASMQSRFNARLDERARLARDLHDTLLQTIQAGKLVTDEALERSKDVIGLRIALEHVSDVLGLAATEGRAALNALHISSTESNDLAAAIRRIVAECCTDNRLKVELAVEGTVRALHPVVRDEVYRIAYETIRNACTHSGATLLRIQILYAQDLTLRVIDNGKGIDPVVLEHGKEGHYGLASMRERAGRIGAIFDLRGQESVGTKMELTVKGKSIFRNKRG